VAIINNGNSIEYYEKIQNDLIQRPRKWLITGVAGFIGSNILEKLLKLNQTVVGLDNYSTGAEKNISDVLAQIPIEQQKNFTMHLGDICSLNDCDKAVRKVDYVLHQAALGSVPRSIKDPVATHANNSSGFLNILIAAKNASVKRIVYASSSSVYGDSPILPKQENIIGQPLSPYAVSKFSNELYAKAFASCYNDFQAIGLRYFNVFGPRQNPEGPYAAVIPRWIAALLNDDTVYINGDGSTSRDFCYIENVIQANILAAVSTNIESINTVYNIAFGQKNTLQKLYDLIHEMLALENKPKIVYQDFRAGDIHHSLADITKANRLLGYSPIFSLQHGLQKLVEYYKKYSVP
jgi:UDP-N-acetylglucosamine 4-epimerase